MSQESVSSTQVYPVFARFEGLWNSALAEPHGTDESASARRWVRAIQAVLEQAHPESLWADILDHLMAAVGAERAFIVERRDGSFRVVFSRTVDREPVANAETKVPTKLLGEVRNSRSPFLGLSLNSVPARIAQKLREIGVQAAIALPLIAGNNVLGALYLDNRFREFDMDERHMGELLLASECLALCLSAERHQRSLAERIQEVQKLQGLVEGYRHGYGDRRKGAPAEPTAAAPSMGGLRIVTRNPQLLEILRLIEKVSHSSAPVLINGDTGTGKELVAQAIHLSSPRRDKRFVSENCGALTETLLESELFGYVKGAFTGANQDRMGLFEIADGGSLFLDEVGDMSPNLQKKLLRALQEGVIRRVGGKDPVHVDVRVISATNKDLLKECHEGRFREDLYYRLNVINVQLPPLRERKEDVPLLVEHFLAEIAGEGETPKEIEPAAMQRLMQYPWPGNVRELQNEVRKLHTLSGPTIRVEDLSDRILSGEAPSYAPGASPYEDMSLKQATQSLERDLIRRALVRYQGNKSLVSKKLQIPKTSLYNKIGKYKLQ